MRRAKIAQARMRLVCDVLEKRYGQPRFADARLTGDQHHSALAGICLLPAAQQELNFLLTPDERRRLRAQGLEAAHRAAFAQHPPRALQSGKPGKLLRPEILQIEQRADLPPRVFGNDERTWGDQTLQSGSEVWRLADNPPLLCSTLADQVADDGKPGGDAEPHAQILSRRQTADRLDHREAGAHRPLGVVLMRLRIAEIDQDAVAHVLGDKAVQMGDRLGDGVVVVADQLTQIFRVITGRECRRADQIAEHHRELTAFGGVRARWGRGQNGWRWSGDLAHRLATTTAELRGWLILEAAGRTRQ